jgi:hypothetical protein
MKGWHLNDRAMAQLLNTLIVGEQTTRQKSREFDHCDANFKSEVTLDVVVAANCQARCTVMWPAFRIAIHIQQRNRLSRNVTTNTPRCHYACQHVHGWRNSKAFATLFITFLHTLAHSGPVTLRFLHTRTHTGTQLTSHIYRLTQRYSCLKSLTF